MNFSEFMQKLHHHCGNGQTPDNFTEQFLKEIVDEYNEKILLKDDATYRKYFKNSRNLPKQIASYLLSHIDNNNFANFIESNIGNDSLIDLCHEFKDFVNTTPENIAEDLIPVFKSILKNILQIPEPTKNSVNNFDSSFKMEKKISEIIQKLANISQEKLNIKLSYEPITIDKKIEDKYSLLKEDIKHNVVQYYPFIENIFKEKSKQNSIFFQRLAEEVKRQSDNLLEEGNSKEHIFEMLVQWLERKANTTEYTACRAIIAFFVQNCEVFYEIP